jgi:phosphoribosylpyrophosphate synthetase
VPLHPAKRRQRGFNQAELIAGAMMKRLRHPHRRSSVILRRRRQTESQTGLTREQRALNLRGAFAAESRGEVDGRSFLLVDDVLTTGATVCECARVLRRGGAAGVWVATVARVLAPSQRRPEGPKMLNREAAVATFPPQQAKTGRAGGPFWRRGKGLKPAGGPLEPDLL